MRLSNIFKKPAPNPSEFWTWFVANEKRFAITTGREPIINEIGRRLEPFDVVWEMSAGESAPREFVISADGLRERIPQVQRLVAAAPNIPGWKVTAFRQRCAEQIEIRNVHAGEGVEHLDVWFRALPNNGLIDLLIFMQDSENKQLRGLTFIMLDSVLGEYDVMTRVGAIDWLPLPPDPVRDGLAPIDRLAAVADELWDKQKAARP